MTEPTPAEILRRARPIPTFRDHPATVACDVAGVDCGGAPRTVDVVTATAPVVLLFLSSDCLGCRDLWEGTELLRRDIPVGARLVVVTRGPEVEDASAVAALAQPGAEVVMSTRAFDDHRVGGPPFVVVVAGGVVRSEGVAWGLEETARLVRAALER